MSDAAIDLIKRTYTKVNKTLFNRPFLYDKLNISNWLIDNDIDIRLGQTTKPLAQPTKPNTSLKPSSNLQQIQATPQYRPSQIRNGIITRWDIANREKDLKLFIKVPTSCKSSITILEGDYIGFNDAIYMPTDTIAGKWTYLQNHNVLNFNTNKRSDNIDLNNYSFKPISKLQLLAFNTGEAYPFADRLVEYLSGSAITPLDEMPDNIKRVQQVMEQNKNYFKIKGLWENKMQNILYDYVVNSGPVVVTPDGKLRDKHTGIHPRLGHTTKSTLYDILGYVDKDTEKWYSSWKNENGVAVIKDNIQNVDIYDGLYDI
jgi:hypothetical protein